jgi:hypothetical protein
MCQIFVLAPAGRKEPSLNLSILSMSILQLLPDPACLVLYLNPIELRLTQTTIHVVDPLVIGIEHVPRSRSKEVQKMNISYVHRDIP